MLIFLDIDETLAEYRKILPDRVSCLNWVIHHSPEPCQIVFNTAWNIHNLEFMREKLIAAGFQYPECILGQTYGNQGGGDLIREWLTKNNQIGTPFIIIDDSTRHMKGLWSRLAHCDPVTGFTPEVAERALQIMHRDITEEGERQAACENLLRCALLQQTKDWLTKEQKAEFTKSYLDLMATLLATEDFLREAYLKV